MSSTCRSCGEYFKIKDGQAIANRPDPINPFGSKVVPPPTSVQEEPAPSPKEELETPPAPPSRHDQDAAPPLLSVPGVISDLRRAAKRDIDCLECGHTHSIAPAAILALCPHCGSSISLRDFQINDSWNERIETRGDVFVGETGRLAGTTVQCYNLTIEGLFEGGADCSGELQILGRADISGRLQCKRLHVGKHAHLKLDYLARAREITIDGTVEGDLESEGCIILMSQAIVHGDLKAASLVVHSGGHHSGLIHLTGLPIATQVSDAMSVEDEA